MASLRRDWYLANLGIVRYIPVDEICAEVAPLGEEQSADSESVEPISLQPVISRLAQPIESAQPVENESTKHLLAELDAPRVVEPPSQQDNPVRSTGAQAQADSPQLVSIADEALQEQPFECRLGFWQASDRLVVLSAMPAGQRPTAGQVTMLTNLLKAIKRLDSSLPPVDLIDWPQTAAIGLQGIARDLRGARDFVSVFLQAKARLQPFTHVLLMGDAAARVATDSNSVEPGQQFDLHCGARGIVTRSLHEMEHNPGLKGETWQAIKFLALSNP